MDNEFDFDFDFDFTVSKKAIFKAYLEVIKCLLILPFKILMKFLGGENK